ncbi:TPA: hypothetical protein HA249_05640 [Candidatus Woesearchaeota archaeon]|nr:hypothetical protein [Candidatus Woesearchaeota archaeon]HIH47586.1 hypothetical protein [Candidatus Woesearchaeota archaeon]
MKDSTGDGCCSTSSTTRQASHRPSDQIKEASESDASSKSESTGSWTMYAIIGVAVLLLVFSAVQTFQIGKTEDNLVSGFAVGGRPAGGGSPAGISIPQVAPSAPPRMVGGC